MVQRVGIAQALINEPELVFLDEPMSGLDPLGRREVRELILRLRDRGCTVFFSSHVLSDAEALCSRVAILAKGRLAAIGSLDELTSVGSRGWELVVVGTERRGPHAPEAAHHAGDATRRRPVLAGAAALHGPRAAHSRARRGARVVSLNPLRGTLEDVFVEQVRRGGWRVASPARWRHEIDRHHRRRRLQRLDPRSASATAWCSSRSS